jgi:Heme oxygenase
MKPSFAFSPSHAFATVAIVNILILAIGDIFPSTQAFSVVVSSTSHPKYYSFQLQHSAAGSPGSTTGVVDTTAAAPAGFIDTELRGAAMRLHTKSQSPKEGQVEDKPPQHPNQEPYVPTLEDYLKFLVDSQHVYQTFEEVIKMPELSPELTPFCNTGLERTERLQQDIEFITREYNLEKPSVGSYGESYAKEIRNIALKGKEALPEFMCHYYNYYFAHTAGGRMIGKQMSALLLDRKTLEFYKWDGDLNEIKGAVKESIEQMAQGWSREQKDMCVGATMDAFRGGGGINAYLSGGGGASPSSH